MAGVSDGDRDPTGPLGNGSDNRIERARKAGRRYAVRVVTADDPETVPIPDGGLSPAALRYAANTPDASVEDVIRYDRGIRPYRDVDAAALPPRGPNGDLDQNLERSVVLNTARAAIRKYRELEGRTG